MSRAKKPTDASGAADYVNDHELAARTGIGRSTWQHWRAMRKGPPYYRFGRRCVYRWSEVETWMASQRVG